MVRSVLCEGWLTWRTCSTWLASQARRRCLATRASLICPLGVTHVSKKRAKPRVERQEPRCRRVDLAWNKAHGARVEFLETVWSMHYGSWMAHEHVGRGENTATQTNLGNAPSVSEARCSCRCDTCATRVWLVSHMNVESTRRSAGARPRGLYSVIYRDKSLLSSFDAPTCLAHVCHVAWRSLN